MDYTLEYLEGLKEEELGKISLVIFGIEGFPVATIYMGLTDLGFAPPLEERFLDLYFSNELDLAKLLERRGISLMDCQKITKLEACRILSSFKEMQKEVSLEELRSLLNLQHEGILVPKLVSYSNGVATFESPELFPTDEEDSMLDSEGRVWVVGNWSKYKKEKISIQSIEEDEEESSCEIVDY